MCSLGSGGQRLQSKRSAVPRSLQGRILPWLFEVLVTPAVLPISASVVICHMACSPSLCLTFVYFCVSSEGHLSLDLGSTWIFEIDLISRSLIIPAKALFQISSHSQGSAAKAWTYHLKGHHSAPYIPKPVLIMDTRHCLIQPFRFQGRGASILPILQRRKLRLRYSDVRKA